MRYLEGKFFSFQYIINEEKSRRHVLKALFKIVLLRVMLDSLEWASFECSEIHILSTPRASTIILARKKNPINIIYKKILLDQIQYNCS